jgi:hypothetical protein
MLLVTDNIFDFLKYTVTTLFALGDRKITTAKAHVFVAWLYFHCAKYVS